MLQDVTNALQENVVYVPIIEHVRCAISVVTQKQDVPKMLCPLQTIRDEEKHIFHEI